MRDRTLDSIPLSHLDYTEHFRPKKKTRIAALVQAYPLDVCQDSCAVLQPGIGVLKLGTLGCQELADKATNPAAASKDKEDLQNDRQKGSADPIYTLKHEMPCCS